MAKRWSVKLRGTAFKLLTLSLVTVGTVFAPVTIITVILEIPITVTWQLS